MTIPVTAVILAKNAELTLEQTFKSLDFCEHILVIDDNSTDKTVDVAKTFKAQVETVTELNFGEKRTKALELCITDWIFYVDADEIVSEELQRRISSIVELGQVGSYRIRRNNWFLGTQMYADYVDRLFHTSQIQGWTGAVHESPVVKGNIETIEEPLIHHTHRSIGSMLEKTNSWSEYEAQLRVEAHHPMMSWWRLIRIGATFFWSNYVGKRLYRFGRNGLFEAYFQMIDKLIVYTKLWEFQNR